MNSSAELDALLAGPVLEVAPRLLGARLRRDGITVRITEVEAYDGARDPGSHAYRGPTARNATMYGPPGRLYVYFVYGLHHCCNVVTGPQGRASAVLLRAGEIEEGVELVRRRRAGRPDVDLARGPANLCAALGIGRDLDGVDLAGDQISLHPAGESGEHSRGPRVGLRHGADLPWRFWLTGEPTVSHYRAAVPRPPSKGPADL